MNLLDAKINQEVIIKNLNILDKKFKTRLQELGLYNGSKVAILNFSPLRQTILLRIFNSAFALKSEIAKQVEVEVCKKF